MVSADDSLSGNGTERTHDGPARDFEGDRLTRPGAAASADAAATPAVVEGRDPPPPRKRLLIAGVIGSVLAVGVVAGVLYYLHARQFQTTDDAFIDAHSEMLAPQIAGRVMRVLVNDNQQVNAGDPVLEIDPADYEVQLEQARAAVAEAEGHAAQASAQREVAAANVEQTDADVELAQSNLENAQTELKRYEGLSREAVSPQRLDDLRTASRNAAAQLSAVQKRLTAARAQVTLADTQIRAAQAGVRSATAKQAQAQLQRSYATVRATVGGRVTNRNVQAGDYVTAGQQVLILVPHDLWVTANFKETQLADVRPGQAVTIRVDAYPDVAFTGRVDSVQRGSGAVFSLLPPENATGNYVKVVQRVPVKIVFDNSGGDAFDRLGPGMSVSPSVRVR